VDGAVGALGQRLADGRSHALWPRAQHDHLAAVLFFELQRLFEGIGVRLVHRELQIGFVNPLAVGCNAHRRIALGNLLDCNNDLHLVLPQILGAPSLPRICFCGKGGIARSSP
jgi:hypothetical protein